MKKKRVKLILAIIISLPLAIVGASSQSIPLGSVFGFILAISTNSLIETFEFSRIKRH